MKNIAHDGGHFFFRDLSEDKIQTLASSDRLLYRYNPNMEVPNGSCVNPTVSPSPFYEALFWPCASSMLIYMKCLFDFLNFCNPD